MRILLVALRGAQYLRCSGVDKYRVSEQEDIGGHGRHLRFVNENVYSKTFNIQVERVREAFYHTTRSGTSQYPGTANKYRV